jgi:AcrR family transcriptional regulator
MMNGGSLMQYLKEEIKNNIISAAIKEFNRNGYHDASMRTIASNAGIAIGNVYRYFKNKDELFNTIVEPAYSRFTSMVFDLYQNHDPIPEIHFLADDITDKIMEFYEKYGTELLILIDKSKGSKYENIKEELIRLINHRIKSELTPVFKDKGIVLQDDYILYVVATTFIEGIFMILRKYNDHTKIKELIGQLLIIFFDDFYKNF